MARWLLALPYTVDLASYAPALGETGLASYRSLRHHHNPKTIRDTESYMEPKKSALHRSTERIGTAMSLGLSAAVAT